MLMIIQNWFPYFNERTWPGVDEVNTIPSTKLYEAIVSLIYCPFIVSASILRFLNLSHSLAKSSTSPQENTF